MFYSRLRQTTTILEARSFVLRWYREQVLDTFDTYYYLHLDEEFPRPPSAVDIEFDAATDIAADILCDMLLLGNYPALDEIILNYSASFLLNSGHRMYTAEDLPPKHAGTLQEAAAVWLDLEGCASEYIADEVRDYLIEEAAKKDSAVGKALRSLSLYFVGSLLVRCPLCDNSGLVYDDGDPWGEHPTKEHYEACPVCNDEFVTRGYEPYRKCDF